MSVCLRCGERFKNINKHYERKILCEAILSDYTYEEIKNRKLKDGQRIVGKKCNRCCKFYIGRSKHPSNYLERIKGSSCDECWKTQYKEIVKDQIEMIRSFLSEKHDKVDGQSDEEYLKTLIDVFGECSDYDKFLEVVTQMSHACKGINLMNKYDELGDEMRKYIKIKNDKMCDV